MKEIETIRKRLKVITILVIIIAFMVFLVANMLILYSVDPELTTIRQLSRDHTPEAKLDPNRIVNGVHVRTGLLDGEGLMTVVNNCTNCHSSKLVVQNRMNAAQWKSTIDWMQRTQNLWDLGDQEEVIINYLVTQYPIRKKGRRENLSNIEWYALEE